MRHHPQRVNARIRAAGTVQARLAREEAADGFFNFFLHARADLLHLPALIRRTVVGDDEFEFECVHRVFYAAEIAGLG